jgi:hypothetical protein
MPNSCYAAIGVDKAHDNVAASDRIGDSRLWIPTLRSEFIPSMRHDCDAREEFEILLGEFLHMIGGCFKPIAC